MTDHPDGAPISASYSRTLGDAFETWTVVAPYATTAAAGLHLLLAAFGIVERGVAPDPEETHD